MFLVHRDSLGYRGLVWRKGSNPLNLGVAAARHPLLMDVWDATRRTSFGRLLDSSDWPVLVQLRDEQCNPQDAM